MRSATINYDVKNQKGVRFDASYHLSEGLIIRRMISSSPYDILSINDVSSDIFYGNRGKRIYVSKKENGVPFLSSSDILKADLDNVKLASKKYTPSIEQMKLQRGWTLISRSGTIGNCAFTNNNHFQKLASEHVIRVVPNNKIKEGVVYAYLASKYGHSLLTQGTFGAVIQHIEPDFVGSIPIPSFPILFQESVDGYIRESAKLREIASNKLSEAKRLLSSYINEEYKPVGFKTQVVTSQDIVNSLKMRFDPPALIKEGVQIMNKVVDKFNCSKIGDLKCNVFRPGIFKRVYVNNGIPYIKGAEAFFTNPFRSCVHVSKTKTPFLDELALREGQILVMCAGTVSVGQVKIITKEYEDKKSIGSQDIIRIESSDELITKEYLFVYLQLPFVIDYIISMKYGSVIERIEPFHVESIPVVKPPKSLSENITCLIRDYMDSSYKAFNYEEKAISMVEQEIEKWNN